VPLKVVKKPACDSEIVPKAGYECAKEKLTNGSQGKPEQKFDAAFGTTFRISKCSKRSKLKLHIGFSLKLSRLKI
jgi:hypothetical protein